MIVSPLPQAGQVRQSCGGCQMLPQIRHVVGNLEIMMPVGSGIRFPAHVQRPRPPKGLPRLPTR